MEIYLIAACSALFGVCCGILLEVGLQRRRQRRLLPLWKIGG